jgi:hypothetical protein
MPSVLWRKIRQGCWWRQGCNLSKVTWMRG